MQQEENCRLEFVFRSIKNSPEKLQKTTRVSDKFY